MEVMENEGTEEDVLEFLVGINGMLGPFLPMIYLSSLVIGYCISKNAKYDRTYRIRITHRVSAGLFVPYAMLSLAIVVVVAVVRQARSGFAVLSNLSIGISLYLFIFLAELFILGLILVLLNLPMTATAMLLTSYWNQTGIEVPRDSWWAVLDARKHRKNIREDLDTGSTYRWVDTKEGKPILVNDKANWNEFENIAGKLRWSGEYWVMNTNEDLWGGLSFLGSTTMWIVNLLTKVVTIGNTDFRGLSQSALMRLMDLVTIPFYFGDMFYKMQIGNVIDSLAEARWFPVEQSRKAFSAFTHSSNVLCHRETYIPFLSQTRTGNDVSFTDLVELTALFNLYRKKRSFLTGIRVILDEKGNGKDYTSLPSVKAALKDTPASFQKEFEDSVAEFRANTQTLLRKHYSYENIAENIEACSSLGYNLQYIQKGISEAKFGYVGDENLKIMFGAEGKNDNGEIVPADPDVMARVDDAASRMLSINCAAEPKHTCCTFPGPSLYAEQEVSAENNDFKMRRYEGARPPKQGGLRGSNELD